MNTHADNVVRGIFLVGLVAPVVSIVTVVTCIHLYNVGRHRHNAPSRKNKSFRFKKIRARIDRDKMWLVGAVLEREGLDIDFWKWHLSVRW